MRQKPAEGQVRIPKTSLREQIDEAAALKRAMREQLRALEERAAGRPIANPGAWRHDTSRWPPQAT